jgi:hypothetical protein
MTQDTPRINVTLSAKSINELKVKIKRYCYSYNKDSYDIIVENHYEENGLFKVLISRLK